MKAPRHEMGDRRDETVTLRAGIDVARVEMGEWPAEIRTRRDEVEELRDEIVVLRNDVGAPRHDMEELRDELPKCLAALWVTANRLPAKGRRQ